MSRLTTSGLTLSAIFSQASGSGATRSVPQAGPTTAPSGPAPAHANLSARRAKERGLMTSGTFGRPGSGSSKSADLQSLLESRLRARTRTLGSTLYKMTWKPWDTGSGRSRFRLRASALRTSETASIGWPTPTARDYRDYANLSTSMYRGKDGVLRKDVLTRASWIHLYGTKPFSPSKEQMEKFVSWHLAHARTLMGLPPAWDECADMATQSTPSKRASSSKK